MAQDTAGFDPGFVLDEASGLYFHASSGFYHDANAGWYYNTNDGVYYKFEEGIYVPLAAAEDSANVVPDSVTKENGDHESTGFDVKELRPSSLQDSGLSESVEGVTSEAALVSKSSEVGDVSQVDTSKGFESDTKAVIGSADVGFPLWYYDSLRSIYWYYDKETRAYYKYNEEAQNGWAETTVLAESTANADRSQQEQILMEESGGGMEGLKLHETEQQGENEDNFKPASGWIEETLIDLYLRGYPNESTENDGGPWITSADIFSDGSPRDLPRTEQGRQETSHHRDSLPINDPSLDVEMNYDSCARQVSVDESDEGSEELEEGEWVPDEPLRIVDGNLFGDGDQVEERMDSATLESTYSAEPYADDGGYYGDLEDGELEDGEIEQDNGGAMFDLPDDFAVEGREDHPADNGRRIEEEQWQAQFGQVVRERATEHAVPGAIELWDWMIAEMEPNTLKPGKVTKKLVGRIASSVTKLVSASSGLIRTSAIRSAELDFVKVSSGKVYRLRRPSRKHLNSVGLYDSSNPTKDWGFPVLGLSLLNNQEDHSVENETAVNDQTERRTESLVSKPFVPNTGHWKFKGLASAKTKKGRGMPAALLATKYLSPEESSLNEQRKQRYRDRAAERRTLHGGFGTGPGQKGLTPQEQEKADAENAAGMDGALRTASLALPLGKDNVGKRMLEGMGWKEGETLGVEGGLAAPIQAQGNDGRAGLGWR